jgi:hypothetical protein
LIIDQHAIPTLVEVKRSTDTRIRREVVSQMLDYAANADNYDQAITLAHKARDYSSLPERVGLGKMIREFDLRRSQRKVVAER